MSTQPQAGSSLPPEFQKVVDAYKAEMEERAKKRADESQGQIDAINAKKPSQGPPNYIKLSFDVKWTDHEFILNLPSVTMKEQKIIMDLPSATMKEQKWSYGVPSTRPKNVQVGVYPEFHDLSIEWKPIIITVPEPYIQQVETVLNVPEFAMVRNEFIVSLPEFRMVENRIVLTLPEFTLRNIETVAQEMQADGKRLKAETEAAIASDMKEVTAKYQSQLVKGMHETFASSRADLTKQRDAVFNLLQINLDQMKSALTKVPSTSPSAAQIQAKLDEIVKQIQNTQGEFQKAFDGIDTQEKDAIAKLLNQLTPQTTTVQGQPAGSIANVSWNTASEAGLQMTYA
jgi:hypothetical protein